MPFISDRADRESIRASRAWLERNQAAARGNVTPWGGPQNFHQRRSKSIRAGGVRFEGNRQRFGVTLHRPEERRKAIELDRKSIRARGAGLKGNWRRSGVTLHGPKTRRMRSRLRGWLGRLTCAGPPASPVFPVRPPRADPPGYSLCCPRVHGPSAT